MDENKTQSLQDVARTTAILKAELMTAKGAKDQDAINASLFQIIDGLIDGMQNITSELLKVEIEGIDKASF